MKILLVDDNNAITRLFSKFIKLKGHDCIATNSGMEGLTLCLKEKFDVIILDLAMPEFTGMDFLESLNRQGKIREQKIIIFTSMPMGEIKIDDGSHGICAVLNKPVSLNVMIKTIESLNVVA